MNMKTRSRGFRQTVSIWRMVITAMLGAVTALLTFTPVGMIMLPPPLPAVTLVHIPVILAALAEGPWVGVPVGLIFGLCSLIRAWGSGMVGLTLFFRNPLVSVLPRMIIPIAAWAAYLLWGKLFGQNKVADKLGAGVAAAVGALTNTVLCLGAIVLLYGADLTVLVNNLISLGNANNTYVNNAGAWLVVAVGLPNGLAEAAVAALLVPMVKTAVDAISHRSQRNAPAMKSVRTPLAMPNTENAGLGAQQTTLTDVKTTAFSTLPIPESATTDTVSAAGASPAVPEAGNTMPTPDAAEPDAETEKHS